MDDENFNRIMQGLQEAVEHAQGGGNCIVHHYPAVPVDVQAIREASGLGHRAFADRYGFHIDDVRAWEAGESRPAGAERVLLIVLAREPEAVERALAVV